MPSTRRTTEFEADIEAKKCQLIADFFVGHTVLVPQRSGKPSLIGKVVNLTACKRFACVHVHGVSIDGEEHPMPESDIEIETSSLEKFYFDYTREHEPILAGKSHPEGYYDYVVHLYKLGSKVEEEVKDAEKQFNKCKRRFEQTQEKYDKVFANAEGPVYERSITNKLETATCRLNEAQEKLTEINTRRCLLKFASAQSCVDYVKNKYNINLMRRTLARRVKGFGKKAVGGIVALPPEVEENLMRTALEFDKMGFAVTEHFVIELANATRRDTRASPLGQGWYKAWFNRCKRRNPDLVQVFTSKLKTAVFDSYNSTSINWWYDVVKHSLVHDLQVAKEVHVESKPQREMDWLFPNRVLIFDETSLYGQKDIESRTGYKVITEKGRIDCGGRVRRTDVKAPSGHVTFIAGHNLTMNTMPLVAILSRRITEEVRAEINIALKGKVGSDRFGPANGQLYSDLILGESAEGSVTKDNIKEVILDGVIKTMYPDASNDDPSKRVVIFIDWHGSRLSSDFLSECRSRGVYIHCWLPNCTPTMQSPDIVLFGKFKSVFKSLTRKQYKKLSMVDLVSLGVDAVAKVANSSNYHEGVKLSGMLPFTRQVHFNLNKEIIRIGDERARLKLEKIRTSHLDANYCGYAQGEQEYSNCSAPYKQLNMSTELRNRSTTRKDNKGVLETKPSKDVSETTEHAGENSSSSSDTVEPTSSRKHSSSWCSCTNIFWLVFILYFLFIGWVLHYLSQIPTCEVRPEGGSALIPKHGDPCFYPLLQEDESVNILIIASPYTDVRKSFRANMTETVVAWEVGVSLQETVSVRGDVYVPPIVRAAKENLFAHIMVIPNGPKGKETGALEISNGSQLQALVYQAVTRVVVPLTTMSASSSNQKAQKRSLIHDDDNVQEAQSTNVIVQTDGPLIRPFYRYVYHPVVLRYVEVTEPMATPVNFHSLDRLGRGAYAQDRQDGKKKYYPTIYLDETGLLHAHKVELSPDSSRPPVPLVVRVTPISVLRNSWVLLLTHGMTFLQQAMSERELDEIRYLLSDDHIYRFILTQVISWLHLAFDFMAFKNDIGFYVGRKDMAGVSASSLIAQFSCSLIIFLYLHDGGGTSMVVLVSVGSSVLVEGWKVFKILRPRFVSNFPFVALRDLSSLSNNEQLTVQYDIAARRYLWFVIGPLIMVWSLYALYSYTYTSWYSWLVSSLANAVYGFGFISMCPQLYINYKLKSVAHLPWRVFMYKIFNTFVDDVFAFIIEMPLKHRLMTLRDDVVFVVYLYQAYIYRVDHSRPNEFGFVYEDAEGSPTEGDQGVPSSHIKKE